jgi:Transmembrane domain of unknown function (DUF3566)
MRTEEDGVDEAGPTTQPPLIMAPPSLKADLDDDEAADSSDTAAEAEAEAEGEAGPGTVVPLPADTIGKARIRIAGSSGAAVDNGRTSERQGGRPTMTSGDSSAWLADQTAKAAESADSAAPAASVADYRPPFTPPAATAPTSARTGYVPPVGYPQSDWPTTEFGPRTTTASGAPATATSAGGWGSVHSASPRSAPAGTAAPPGNGYSSSNGFPSAAAPAAPVTSPWQQRGSARDTAPRVSQSRKPAKRQAMLTLARVEPWSVMKFSFVASVVAFVILFVAVAVLYMVLSALGVFDSLQHTISSITGSQNTSGTNISRYYSASVVLGYTALLGALNIVLITAMSTVGSVIYNLIAKTIGGIEVTLRETD